MSDLAVLGAGAFGTALAVAFSGDGASVVLWARDKAAAEAMEKTRRSSPRLPGISLPASLRVTVDLTQVNADIVLIAVPMSGLNDLLERADLKTPQVFVACMKGIDQESGQTPTEILRAARPQAQVAALTGPSFAADIANGLPTAITLACVDDGLGAALQERLSTPNLRLYRTTDVKGAELGGAIKNVVALAAGVAAGAGLGASARASVIARGMAEMVRLAEALGGQPSTLAGLSGLGDLVLTATSEKSRNYRAGLALGSGTVVSDETIEGLATARALSDIAARQGIDAPIAATITQLINQDTTVDQAVAALLARPLKKE